MMRLLVSVRDAAEARAAAEAGADFIDLKEPGAGALGGLPVATIGAVAAMLRATHPHLPVSATIGDIPPRELDLIAARVAAVGGCGVDYVKVGVAGPGAATLLARLAALPWAVVPVFIADAGLDFHAVDTGCALPFPALMADTQDKRAGSLFDCVPHADLARFVARVQAVGKLAGLAGALREVHLERLQALAPDFAGFRSAVCRGERDGELEPERVQRLRYQVSGAQPRSTPPSPSRGGIEGGDGVPFPAEGAATLPSPSRGGIEGGDGLSRREQNPSPSLALPLEGEGNFERGYAPEVD